MQTLLRKGAVDTISHNHPWITVAMTHACVCMSSLTAKSVRALRAATLERSDGFNRLLQVPCNLKLHCSHQETPENLSLHDEAWLVANLSHANHHHMI